MRDERWHADTRFKQFHKLYIIYRKKHVDVLAGSSSPGSSWCEGIGSLWFGNGFSLSFAIRLRSICFDRQVKSIVQGWCDGNVKWQNYADQLCSHEFQLFRSEALWCEFKMSVIVMHFPKNRFWVWTVPCKNINIWQVLDSPGMFLVF